MVSEIQKVKVHDDIIIFQRDFFPFFGHIFTYIRWNRNLMLNKVSLEIMVWKCMVFEIQGVNVNRDVIIFQTNVFIFPSMSIYVL